jgi:hypothetical protein
MTQQELDELLRLAREETTFPWTVKPLLGQFIIKDKDGKGVQPTLARCRMIELFTVAIRSSLKEQVIIPYKVEEPTKEAGGKQRRARYEDRSDIGASGAPGTHAGSDRSDEL